MQFNVELTPLRGERYVLGQILDVDATVGDEDLLQDRAGQPTLVIARFGGAVERLLELDNIDDLVFEAPERDVGTLDLELF